MNQVATPSGQIPFALRIGVVGHRSLSDPEAVRQAAHAAVDRLRQRLPGTPTTPVVFHVFSSLAEGADRIVAREILSRPGSSLVAVLPFPPTEYASDFPSEESRREFDALLGRAADRWWPAEALSREEGYELSGQEVVDRSDVLVAVWDGESTGSQAGTAPAVSWARARCMPVIVIDPVRPDSPVEEPGTGLPWDQFEELDHFNRAIVGNDQLIGVLSNRIDRLSSITPAWAEAHLAWHAPTFARAETLARHYGRMNAAIGDALFLLAGLALSTVGAQLLFFPERPGVAWVEVAFLVALLAVLVAGRRLRVHDRWVAYRFLAERLRASLFIAAIGARVARQARSEHVFAAHHAELWLRRAFDETWYRRPPTSAPADDFDAARSYVLDGWVAEQLTYFTESGVRHEHRVRRLEVASIGVFGATVLLAAFHSLGIGHSREGTASWAKVATLLTIGLPALGAALTGIRTQRDHARNSLRFLHMRHDMETARSRLARVENLDRLRRVVEDLDADILDENRDWLLSILIHGRHELGA